MEAQTLREGRLRRANAEHPYLRVRELRKHFLTPAGERLEVLRGISFSVAAGEMVAITGVSGAGKSTLLHLLGGLEAPDTGKIMLGDFDIGRARATELARFRNQTVGFVFQFHHLLQELTAAENVAMPLMIAREPSRSRVRRAEELLERIGLGDRKDHRVAYLSGGEQQRVAVARAIITGPRMVLADEPTGNLDAGAGQQINLLLASYCQEARAAIVIATHNEQLASQCDRTLLLRNGQLEQLAESNPAYARNRGSGSSEAPGGPRCDEHEG